MEEYDYYNENKYEDMYEDDNEDYEEYPEEDDDIDEDTRPAFDETDLDWKTAEEPTLNLVGTSYKDLDRYGVPRGDDGINLGLDTMPLDKKMEATYRLLRTPEQIFLGGASRIINRYFSNNDNTSNLVKSFISKAVNQGRKISFLNPAAVVFAINVIEAKKINKNKLEEIAKVSSEDEGISKLDLVRYSRLIINVLF